MLRYLGRVEEATGLLVFGRTLPGPWPLHVLLRLLLLLLLLWCLRQETRPHGPRRGPCLPKAPRWRGHRRPQLHAWLLHLRLWLLAARWPRQPLMWWPEPLRDHGLVHWRPGSHPHPLLLQELTTSSKLRGRTRRQVW